MTLDLAIIVLVLATLMSFLFLILICLEITKVLRARRDRLEEKRRIQKQELLNAWPVWPRGL